MLLILMLLQAALILGKALLWIDWSWWIIFTPMYVLAALVVVALTCFGGVLALMTKYGRKSIYR